MDNADGNFSDGYRPFSSDITVSAPFLPQNLPIKRRFQRDHSAYPPVQRGVAFSQKSEMGWERTRPEPLAVIYQTDQKLTPVMENFIKALKQPVPVVN